MRLAVEREHAVQLRAIGEDLRAQVGQGHAFTIVRENPVGGFRERADTYVRRHRWTFIIAVINEDCRPASGSAARLDVAPAVADHDAAAQVVELVAW